MVLFLTLIASASAHALEAPATGEPGHDGVMFDLVAGQDVRVVGFGVHLATEAEETVEVRVAPGGWQGAAEADWALISTVTVAGEGAGLVTWLPVVLHVEILEGEVFGVYLRVSSDRLALTPGTAVGDDRARSDALALLEGASVDGLFGEADAPWAFDGWVFYDPGENFPPYGTPAHHAVPQGEATEIPLLGWDPNGDFLLARIAAPPAHGAVDLVPPATALYTPEIGYAGPDAFTFRMFDGEFESTSATTVTIDVLGPENAPPYGLAWRDPVDGGAVTSLSPVLRLDAPHDPEGAPVTVTIGLEGREWVVPVAGLVVSLDLAEEGVALPEHARVTATAQASDGELAGAIVPATFLVRGPNDAPAAPGLLSPPYNAVVATATLVAGWTSDPEGDAVTIEWVVAADPDLVDVIATGRAAASEGPPSAGTGWTTDVAGAVWWSARATDDRGAASAWAPARPLFVGDRPPAQDLPRPRGCAHAPVSGILWGLAAAAVRRRRTP